MMLRFIQIKVLLYGCWDTRLTNFQIYFILFIYLFYVSQIKLSVASKLWIGWSSS